MTADTETRLSSATKHVVVLFGPPAAGKGTQATSVSDMLAIPHIATGDMIRELKQRHDKGETLAPAEKDAITQMNSGALVADETMIGMLMLRIAAADCGNGFLLDGFPRTPVQAEKLDQALAAKGMRISAVIDLTVDDEELKRRVAKRRQETIDAGKAPRSDDDPITYAKRLETYHASTKPTLSYYAKTNPSVVHSLDGMQPIATVTNAIKAVFKKVGIQTCSS